MEAMTRRRVLCGLLVASTMLACFAGWFLVRRPHVTRARFEQVKEGMTRKEVIRILGSAPNGVVHKQVGIADRHDRLLDYDCWVGDDDHALLVGFDDGGTAVDVLVTRTQTQTLTERIRRWLGL
jgi:hypothetical protein